MKNPNPLRWSVALFCLFWFVRGLVTNGADSAGLTGRGLAVTVFAVICVACLGVGVLWTPKPKGAVAFAAGLASALVLLGLARENASPAIITVFVLVGFASGRYPVRFSASLLAVAAGGVTLITLLRGGPAEQLWNVVGLFGMYAFILASRAREKSAETERENLVLAERAHVAREVHDILAHSLSAQLLQLESARLMIKAGRYDESLDLVEKARTSARSGLEETRRAVAALRGDVPPPEQALRDLAAAYTQATGRPCTVTVPAEPRGLRPEAALGIIRTAQEALTNVRKHADGAAVEIWLAYGFEKYELDVTDTGGEATELAASGGGYGLVGMRERAELTGGSLTAGPHGAGFRVHLEGPL